MNRDLYRTDLERAPDPRVKRAATTARDFRSQELSIVRVREAFYRLEPGALDVLRDVGRFRTVAVQDLKRAFPKEEVPRLLRNLRAQGLVQVRTIWTGPRSKSMTIAVLSRTGK